MTPNVNQTCFPGFCYCTGSLYLLEDTVMTHHHLGLDTSNVLKGKNTLNAVDNTAVRRRNIFTGIFPNKDKCDISFSMDSVERYIGEVQNSMLWKLALKESCPEVLEG